MPITEEMTKDCLWLSQQQDRVVTTTVKGRKLILDADWTALEMEDNSVRVDIFTFISCSRDNRYQHDIESIIADGPFHNFLFFKQRWEIDGSFYQDFADVDQVLTDFSEHHDQITCGDYAKTLMAYMQYGGRKSLDWGWLYTKIKSSSQ